MSIQRISDLPPLQRGSAEYKNEQLSDSWFELSYKNEFNSEELTQDYDSRKILFNDCLCSMAEMIDFKSKLSGDIYVNEQLSSREPDNWLYNIEFFANHIKLHSPNPVEISSLVLSQLSVTDPTYGGSLTSESDTDWDKIDNNQSINFGTLKRYIKFCLDNSGQGVPYLTYVFSDHVVDNDSWVLAGSIVDLTQYPDLSVELFGDNNLSSRLKKEQSKDGDTWYYVINGTQLTLPKSDCYMKATSDPKEVGEFVSAQAPNISGEVKNTDVNEALTFADKISSKGALFIPSSSRLNSDTRYGVKQTRGSAYTKLNIDASRCSHVYKNDATTIMPDSNNMLVYFYVGRKANQ